MAKKNHTLGKFLALTTTAAAIGGACYVFRDQIKQSAIYKKSTECFSKLFGKVSDKFCQDEDDFFFDDEEDEDTTFNDVFSEDAKKNREYTSITINQKEEENAAESSDSISEPKEDIKEIFSDDSIPTITFGDNLNASGDSEENDTVTAYENEGLSDVSEDPDVLEEQDKLDYQT